MSTPSDSDATPPITPLEALRTRFATISDPRQPGRFQHRLDEVLMITSCSMLSDNDAFTDMEALAKTQFPWLRTFLSLPHGPPSHDVFSAWVHEAGLSAGHIVCRGKSNELDALPSLLALLELKVTLVSIDAMGTQPAIAEQIHKAGGDYPLFPFPPKG